MKTIIFDPTPLESSEPSFVLVLKLYGVVIDRSLRFLADAAFAKDAMEASNKHIELFWKGLLETSGTRLVVHNREALPKNAFVFMSNHLSLFDVPTILGALPTPARMVAKAELLKIPIFGKAMERAGFVMVDRTNHHKARAQLEKAKEHLRSGVNVWIAPEGTRKRDPNIDLQPFKKGGFHTAMALGVPIVPMWINGSDKVIPADSHLIRPNQTIDVYFGEPISTTGMTKADIPQLMEKVRAAMLKLKAAL